MCTNESVAVTENRSDKQTSTNRQKFIDLSVFRGIIGMVKSVDTRRATRLTTILEKEQSLCS